MYHSKKIGVFVSHIFGDFQRTMCQGITDRAEEYGYATEFFASADGEDFGAYTNGEKSILRIPHFDDFSGVVFISGTYLQADIRNLIARVLAEKCSCPILEIAQHDTIFPHLVLGNGLCARELTVHLIREHHCRRICYVGCESELDSSDPRRDLCAEVMQKYGLSFGEEDAADCSYTRESVASALEAFLSGEKKPDAILCYNDRMAVIVMEYLLRQGLRIPEDICVTGFDDLTVSRNCSPDLTTVTFPLHEMGAKAFDLLRDCFTGKAPLPEETVIPSQPVYRGSCCAQKKHDLPNPLFYENHLLRKVNDREAAMLSDIKLSAALHSVMDLDDGMDLLEDFVSAIEDCQELYLCLYPDWDHISGHIRRIASVPDTMDSTDQIEMVFAFRNGVRLAECRFSGKNILPDYLYHETNPSYIFFPLFYGEREFGYAAMAFMDGKISAGFSILMFLRNINSMLARIFDIRQTGVLVHRLEDISDRDELTLLPNRGGFRLAADRLLAAAASEGKTLLAMRFEVAGLPQITKQYGRAERDFAICVAGHALEGAVSAPNREALFTSETHPAADQSGSGTFTEGGASAANICISHQGGGEFLLLASVEEAEKQNRANFFTRSIETYLDNYNRLHTKPYEIHVLSECRTADAADVKSVEELFP
ncbi:MAG: substrate-binding domain-containing protein [Lachnospiraceae bacterium]|nr:substrate-binding domain-containing protein [Lachnospiraceae bacterium]